MEHLTKQVHEAHDGLLCVKDEVIDLHMCVCTIIWYLTLLLSLHKLLIVDEMALSKKGKKLV